MRLLGHAGKIEWTQDASGLSIRVPGGKAPSPYAAAFAIEGVLP